MTLLLVGLFLGLRFAALTTFTSVRLSGRSVREFMGDGWSFDKSGQKHDDATRRTESLP